MLAKWRWWITRERLNLLETRSWTFTCTRHAQLRNESSRLIQQERKKPHRWWRWLMNLKTTPFCYSSKWIQSNDHLTAAFSFFLSPYASSFLLLLLSSSTPMSTTMWGLCHSLACHYRVTLTLFVGSHRYDIWNKLSRYSVLWGRFGATFDPLYGSWTTKGNKRYVKADKISYSKKVDVSLECLFPRTVTCENKASCITYIYIF